VIAAKSTYWGPAMRESQYAIFHFDIKTMSMRDAQGNYLSPDNDAPLIFDSLDGARAYAQREIAAKPALGCRIYDFHGRVVESFSNREIYDRHHGLPAAKRNVAIGAICLLAGIGGIALDASFNWRLIFGVVFGIRFVWAGCVKLMDGFAGWKAETSGG
jgi:hypothetical protein